MQVSAANQTIRYNEMDVVVTDEQPLEVHYPEQFIRTNEAGHKPSIGVYKVGPQAFKLSANAYDIHVVTDASDSITVKVKTYLLK